MPNVMVVLRKVAPSVQRRKVWLTPTAGVLACDGRTDRCAVKIKKDVELEFFYSAPQCSHCKRCTSYGISVRLSVRPSVIRRYCVKTTARSTVKFALSDSRINIFGHEY